MEKGLFEAEKGDKIYNKNSDDEFASSRHWQ
jgi:hypothetical protein